MAENSRETLSLVARVEQAILREAGLNVAVDLRDHVIVLNGLVESEGARQAAEDVARAAAPGHFLENNVEVEELFPYPAGELAPTDREANVAGETDVEADAFENELEPDFTNQELLEDPTSAMGPSSSGDDPVGEGDEVYVPPTDPVIAIDEHANAHVLGGFTATSDEEVQVDRSALDGDYGDEALAEAILTELREDSMTTDLRIRVHVRNGIAYLRGRVADVDEAEAAEEVARRVPGLEDVVEELEVAGL
jgi:osmotically-inducible protein OsmY